MNAAPSPAAQARLPLAVRLKGVSRSFGESTVLDSVDLSIPRGQFVALLGKSGSGKTTLLRILSGLDDGATGEVLVPALRTTVFQEPRLVPALRVWRNVLLGLSTRGAKHIAIEALAEVGLATKANSWPALLSGGEAQRVALARALVREPQLLLLDEPFAALDALTRAEMRELLRRLRNAHSPAALLVTHDVDEAIELADRILVLDRGRFTTDITLTPAHERQHGTAEASALRLQLLDALGVVNPEQEHPNAN